MLPHFFFKFSLQHFKDWILLNTFHRSVPEWRKMKTSPRCFVVRLFVCLFVCFFEFSKVNEKFQAEANGSPVRVSDFDRSLHRTIRQVDAQTHTDSNRELLAMELDEAPPNAKRKKTNKTKQKQKRNKPPPHPPHEYPLKNKKRKKKTKNQTKKFAWLGPVVFLPCSFFFVGVCGIHEPSAREAVPKRNANKNWRPNEVGVLTNQVIGIFSFLFPFPQKRSKPRRCSWASVLP